MTLLKTEANKSRTTEATIQWYDVQQEQFVQAPCQVQSGLYDILMQGAGAPSKSNQKIVLLQGRKIANFLDGLKDGRTIARDEVPLLNAVLQALGDGVQDPDKLTDAGTSESAVLIHGYRIVIPNKLSLGELKNGLGQIVENLHSRDQKIKIAPDTRDLFENSAKLPPARHPLMPIPAVKAEPPRPAVLVGNVLFRPVARGLSRVNQRGARRLSLLLKNTILAGYEVYPAQREYPVIDRRANLIDPSTGEPHAEPVFLDLPPLWGGLRWENIVEQDGRQRYRMQTFRDLAFVFKPMFASTSAERTDDPELRLNLARYKILGPVEEMSGDRAGEQSYSVVYSFRARDENARVPFPVLNQIKYLGPALNQAFDKLYDFIRPVLWGGKEDWEGVRVDVSARTLHPTRMVFEGMNPAVSYGDSDPNNLHWLYQIERAPDANGGGKSAWVQRVSDPQGRPVTQSLADGTKVLGKVVPDPFASRMGTELVQNGWNGSFCLRSEATAPVHEVPDTFLESETLEEYVRTSQDLRLGKVIGSLVSAVQEQRPQERFTGIFE